MIEKLSMVTRVVEDQEEAVEFYTGTLGLKIKRDHQGPHGRFVTVGPEDDDVQLIIVSPDGFDESDAAELRELIGRDVGLIYHVDDCRETFEELRDRGVEFRDEPEEMPWGVQVVALDPDGNEIVLQEPVRAD